MALIKCVECKKQISKSAKTCPNCGKSRTGGLSILRVLLMVGWLVVACPVMLLTIGFLPAAAIGFIGFIILAIAK